MKITGSDIRNLIYEMAETAEYGDAYAESFFNKIMKDESLLKEFAAYILTNRFTCENQVRGYSVVDVMVWQMDHFKSFLDRDQSKVKSNECAMILNAFDTFMKLKEDPERYSAMLSG